MALGDNTGFFQYRERKRGCNEVTPAFLSRHIMKHRHLVCQTEKMVSERCVLAEVGFAVRLNGLQLLRGLFSFNHLPMAPCYDAQMESCFFNCLEFAGLRFQVSALVIKSQKSKLFKYGT